MSETIIPTENVKTVEVHPKQFPELAGLPSKSQEESWKRSIQEKLPDDSHELLRYVVNLMIQMQQIETENEKNAPTYLTVSGMYAHSKKALKQFTKKSLFRKDAQIDVLIHAIEEFMHEGIKDQDALKGFMELVNKHRSEIEVAKLNRKWLDYLRHHSKKKDELALQTLMRRIQHILVDNETHPTLRPEDEQFLRTLMTLANQVTPKNLLLLEQHRASLKDTPPQLIVNRTEMSIGQLKKDLSEAESNTIINATQIPLGQGRNVNRKAEILKQIRNRWAAGLQILERGGFKRDTVLQILNSVSLMMEQGGFQRSKERILALPEYTALQRMVDKLRLLGDPLVPKVNPLAETPKDLNIKSWLDYIQEARTDQAKNWKDFLKLANDEKAIRVLATRYGEKADYLYLKPLIKRDDLKAWETRINVIINRTQSPEYIKAKTEKLQTAINDILDEEDERIQKAFKTVKSDILEAYTSIIKGEKTDTKRLKRILQVMEMKQKEQQKHLTEMSPEQNRPLLDVLQETFKVFDQRNSELLKTQEILVEKDKRDEQIFKLLNAMDPKEIQQLIDAAMADAEKIGDQATAHAKQMKGRPLLEQSNDIAPLMFFSEKAAEHMEVAEENLQIVEEERTNEDRIRIIRESTNKLLETYWTYLRMATLLREITKQSVIRTNQNYVMTGKAA